MGGVKAVVPEDVWGGHKAPTPVQQAAMDQRSKDSARGGKMMLLVALQAASSAIKLSPARRLLRASPLPFAFEVVIAGRAI